MRRKLKSLGTCTSAVFACVETKPGDQGCLGKASARCAAKAATIARDREKLVATIRAKCNTDPLTFDDLMSASGLAFDHRAVECQATFDTPLVDHAAIAECVAREHGCATELLFDLQQARVHELLARAQVSLDSFPCVPDHVAGGDGNDPDDTGKALTKCAAAIHAAATNFAVKKLGSLGRCVDRLFSCVQTKPGDSACKARASVVCEAEFSKIEAAAAALQPAIDKRCAGIDFATLRGADGANLDALAAQCALYDVAGLESLGDYERCLFRQHACGVEELLTFQAPRADGLLTLLAPPVAVQSVFCPDIAAQAGSMHP